MSSPPLKTTFERGRHAKSIRSAQWPRMSSREVRHKMRRMLGIEWTSVSRNLSRENQSVDLFSTHLPQLATCNLQPYGRSTVPQTSTAPVWRWLTFRISILSLSQQLPFIKWSKILLMLLLHTLRVELKSITSSLFNLFKRRDQYNFVNLDCAQTTFWEEKKEMEIFLKHASI